MSKFVEKLHYRWQYTDYDLQSTELISLQFYVRTIGFFLSTFLETIFSDQPMNYSIRDKISTAMDSTTALIIFDQHLSLWPFTTSATRETERNGTLRSKTMQLSYTFINNFQFKQRRSSNKINERYYCGTRSSLSILTFLSRTAWCKWNRCTRKWNIYLELRIVVRSYFSIHLANVSKCSERKKNGEKNNCRLSGRICASRARYVLAARSCK